MSKQGNSNDQNQGEGDKKSARKYNNDVQRFAKEGRVETAAKEAKDYVEAHPAEAAAAEAAGKAGPHPGANRLEELKTEAKNLWDRASSKLRGLMNRK